MIIDYSASAYSCIQAGDAVLCRLQLADEAVKIVKPKEALVAGRSDLRAKCDQFCGRLFFVQPGDTECEVMHPRSLARWSLLQHQLRPCDIERHAIGVAAQLLAE